jgi:ribosomal protein S18 acetylase RimI-like enzyme
MSTRERARRTVGELASLLSAEGREGLVWQQRMWQIAACLAADASDDEAIRAARQRFDSLDATGFHERAIASERLAELTVRLHGLLRMPPVTLRRARTADAPAVASIWTAGWRDGHLGHVPAELADARTAESFRVRAADRVADTTVAEVGDVVAGFVMVVGDEVEQVYVSSAHRGSGVAGVLLAEAERLVAADGHPIAWLAVVPGNERARRFYERCGWTDDGAFDYEAAQIKVPCRRYVKQVVRFSPPA